VTVRLSCTVMEIWSLKRWTHGRTHGRSGDFMLCSMLCIVLDKQQIHYSLSFLLTPIKKNTLIKSN